MEKAREIRVKADEEFAIEKVRHIPCIVHCDRKLTSFLSLPCHVIFTMGAIIITSLGKAREAGAASY